MFLILITASLSCKHHLHTLSLMNGHSSLVRSDLLSQAESWSDLFRTLIIQNSFSFSSKFPPSIYAALDRTLVSFIF